MNNTPHTSIHLHPRSVTTRRKLYAVAALACLAGLPALTACGGDSAAAARNDSTAFCAQLSDTIEQADAFGDPTTDTAHVADAFDHLADLAPAEISADVRIVADAMTTLAQAPTDDPGALSDALDLVLSPEVPSATERVGAYAVDTCGIVPAAWTD